MRIKNKDGYIYYIFDKLSGGLNLKADPVIGLISDDQTILATNVDFRDGISIQSRDGYARRIANTYAKNIYGIFPFYYLATRHIMVMTWDDTNYDLFDSTTSKDAGTASAIYFFPSVYNDLLFIPHDGNSDSEDYNLKYDGTTIHKLGIDPPASQLSAVVETAEEKLYIPWMPSTVFYLVTYPPIVAVGYISSAETTIYALCSYNNKIYIGTGAHGKLYEWSGEAIPSSIREVAPQIGSDTIIYALVLLTTTIYAGTNTGRLLEWNGPSDTAWTQTAAAYGSETSILSLCVFNDGAGDDLYCGTGVTGLLLYNNAGTLAVVSRQYGSETGINALCVFSSELYGVTSPDGYLLKYNKTNGSELITNGNMELDSNWTSVGTPTTQERSSTQAHGGTYSRKFTVDAETEGIQSAVFTTTTGKEYKVDFWVYPDDTTTIRLVVRKGDNSGNIYTENITGLTQDTWNHVTKYYYETAGGAGAFVQFLSSTGQTSGTWYIDDASLLQPVGWEANHGSAGDDLRTLFVYDDGGGDDLYAAGDDGKLYRWNGTDTLTQVAAQLSSRKIISLAESNSILYGLTDKVAAGTGYYVYSYNIGSGIWELATGVSILADKTVKAILGFTPTGHLNGTYQYYYSYYNSVTGHESALSPISNSIVPNSQQVTLSGLLASSDSQVDYKRIYRTGGTLSTINYIDEIANATTIYDDNLADTAVGVAEDCSINKVLAAVRYFAIHHHQLFAAYNSSNKGYIYDSRFYKPEAFPGTYFYRVGNDTDSVVAVMPLDIDIIVYTKWHTYRLRYIGASEGDTVLEEIAPIGLAAISTLAVGVTSEGKPYHVFLGQSAKRRGIYINLNNSISLISHLVDPIFTGERGAEDPISQVTAIAWTYVNTCVGVFARNKYFLAYPETGQTKPNKILVTDFNFTPPIFYLYDIACNSLSYDIITDDLMFGGDTKEVYYLTGTSDWISGAAAAIVVNYQTPYFGDRNRYQYLNEIVFHANTRGATLTVYVYVDFTLTATLTCSSTSMGRITLKCPDICVGHLFSIKFTWAGTVTANRRLKISPPLECKFSTL